MSSNQNDDDFFTNAPEKLLKIIVKLFMLVLLFPVFCIQVYFSYSLIEFEYDIITKKTDFLLSTWGIVTFFTVFAVLFAINTVAILIYFLFIKINKKVNEFFNNF